MELKAPWCLTVTPRVRDSCVLCPTVGSLWQRIPPVTPRGEVIGPLMGNCPLLSLTARHASFSGYVPAGVGYLAAMPASARYLPGEPAWAGSLWCSRNIPHSGGHSSGHAGIQGLPVLWMPFYDISRSTPSHVQGKHAFKSGWRRHACLSVPAPGCWKEGKYLLSPSWAELPFA